MEFVGFGAKIVNGYGQKEEIAAGEREVDANERRLTKFLTELAILGFGLLAV